MKAKGVGDTYFSTFFFSIGATTLQFGGLPLIINLLSIFAR